MRIDWTVYVPKIRFRPVKAFVWQPNTAVPLTRDLFRETIFHKDLREPLLTYEGPGAIVKTLRGERWVFPGDVIVLRGDNTLDVVEPEEFFSVWERSSVGNG